MIKMKPKSLKSIKTTKWKQATLMSVDAAKAGGAF
jgi:hypothetical protein